MECSFSLLFKFLFRYAFSLFMKSLWKSEEISKIPRAQLGFISYKIGTVYRINMGRSVLGSLDFNLHAYIRLMAIGYLTPLLFTRQNH